MLGTLAHALRAAFTLVLTPGYLLFALIRIGVPSNPKRLRS